MNPFNLEGKVILVTGASSGIGRSIAINCSQMGAKLIITGRNIDRLTQTLSMLEGSGHSALPLDLTDNAELDLMVKSLPKLDGFVSNAGIVNPLVLSMTEYDDIERIMHINSYVPMNLTRLIVQHKKINKGASIVFISTINGNNCSSIGSSLYAASKTALNGFMKAVALELAPRLIRVNCINPGMIETDLFQLSNIGEEEKELDRQKYPLKRYGKPEEVAYATIYLLSDATRWITGSSLLIDGGFTIQ